MIFNLVPTFSVQRFATQVRLHGGTSPSQEAAFPRRVETWLTDHGFQFRRMEGGQTSFGAVAERELSATDHADVGVARLAPQAGREVCSGPRASGQQRLSPVVAHLAWAETRGIEPLADAYRSQVEDGRLRDADLLRAAGGDVHRTVEWVGVAI